MADQPGNVEEVDPNYRIDLDFSFDIRYESSDNYLEFIERIRESIAQERCPNFDGVRMLPNDPNAHFRIILTGYHGVVQLIFGIGDLYLKGYRNSNGQWWVFKNYTSPIFRNLPVEEGYGSLHQKSGKERLDITPSRVALDRAVTVVVSNNPEIAKNVKLIAESLLLCTQIFSESIRFKVISKFCNDNFDSLNPKLITRRHADLENCWGKLGEHLPPKDETYPFFIDNNRVSLERMASYTAVIKNEL